MSNFCLQILPPFHSNYPLKLLTQSIACTKSRCLSLHPPVNFLFSFCFGTKQKQHKHIYTHPARLAPPHYTPGIPLQTALPLDDPHADSASTSALTSVSHHLEYLGKPYLLGLFFLPNSEGSEGGNGSGEGVCMLPLVGSRLVSSAFDVIVGIRFKN